MTKTDLGVSSDSSKHLYAYSYGAASPTRKVLIVTGQHGMEHLGMYAAMRWFQQFVTSSHSLMAELRNKLMVTFVPVANPAKYGTTNNPRVNANLVDLNRNWNYQWSAYTPTSDQDYKGTSAASEPETQAILPLITSNTIVLDCHNFGPTPATEVQYIEQVAALASQTTHEIAEARWGSIYGTPVGLTLNDVGASAVPYLINYASSVTGLPSMLIEAPSELFGSIATIGSRYYATREAVRAYAGLITEFLSANVL